MYTGGLGLYTEENKQQGHRYYLPLYATEETTKKINQGNSRYVELDDSVSRKKIVLKEFAEDKQKELRDSNHQFSMLLDLNIKDVCKTVDSLLAKGIDCTVYTRYIIGSKGKATSLKLKANSSNYYEVEQLNKPVFESLQLPTAIEFKIDNAIININTLCELKIKGDLSKRAKAILNTLIENLDIES